MALILLDASGVVSGIAAGGPGTDVPAAPPFLGALAVGSSLADRWQRLAAAGDADAAALHRGLVDLLAGQVSAFEHRHGGWRLGLHTCEPGGAAAAVLVVDRVADLTAEAPGHLPGGWLAQASHDIRTPLNAIASLAHLLGRSLADPWQLRRVQTIEQSARRLGGLFDALLAQVQGRAPAPAAAPRPSSPVAAAEQLRQRHAGRRVLLAEDDDVNQLVMVELLSAVGLAVDTADDGHQAVDRACSGAHALILLDLRMPHLDGIATARTLRTLPGLQATPIVAISANAFDEDRQACRAAGMDDFVAKPVDVPLLYERLLHWLDAGAASVARGGPLPADAASVAPLLGVEGIDAIGGLAAVGGKAAVYRRLLGVFADTHAGDGERLQQQVQRADAAAAAALAHRLRGSAATLGLIDVETAAAALEGAIDDGVDAAALPLLAQAVVDALADTLARLQAALWS